MKIQIEITEDILQKAVEKTVLEALERSYSNPVRDAVDEELKNNEGLIKQNVKSIIAKSLTSPEYQEELQKAVLGKLVSKVLKD